MAKNIIVVGTLDTKGPEFAYLRDRLHGLGLTTTVIDAGILGEPRDIVPDIDHAEAARYGGTTIEALQQAGTRGKAVEGMRDALQQLILKLYQEGKVDGIIGMGGAEGAVMGAACMMILPLGVPKVLISPIASGKHYFEPLVGTSDIMVIHSVVDILGLNPIACTIFDNAAAAMKGLAEHGHELTAPDTSKRYVAVTMLGNTTRAVMALKDRIEQEGYEAVIFHSNGVGGTAMEELAERGQFVGVIDYTTNEVYDPLVGGIHDAGPHRLERVGKTGLPQLIVPGCIDFCVFHSGAIPDNLKGRPVYDHNPEYTLVRTPKAEMIELGTIFSRKLAPTVGPMQIMVPTQGLSIPSVPGGVFWDPDADAAFLEELRANLGTARPDIPIETHEYHVNDPAFGVLVAERFLSMMEQAA